MLSSIKLHLIEVTERMVWAAVMHYTVFASEVLTLSSSGLKKYNSEDQSVMCLLDFLFEFIAI